MRITRFINGEKVNGTMPEQIVVKNEVISEAINKANERVFEREFKQKNTNGLNG